MVRLERRAGGGDIDDDIGLAGSRRVRPGATLPEALHSGRQDWAGRVGRGQPASALPGWY